MRQDYHADENRQPLSPVSETSTYTPPPRSATICAHCGGRFSRTAAWCPTCQRSTVAHINGKLASPGRRLTAHMFDMLGPGIGMGILPRVWLGVAGAGMAGYGTLTTVIMLAWAVWSMFLFANGMTPGKWLLDIYVIDEAGDPAGFFRMLIREWIGKPISMLVFCLGYVWILIDKNNQGWHDKLVDTYVVED